MKHITIALALAAAFVAVPAHAQSTPKWDTLAKAGDGTTLSWNKKSFAVRKSSKLLGTFMIVDPVQKTVETFRSEVTLDSCKGGGGSMRITLADDPSGSSKNMDWEYGGRDIISAVGTRLCMTYVDNIMNDLPELK